MTYYVFLKYPLGEICWAFLWVLPFLAVARFDAIRKKKNPPKLFDDPSYQMISAMLLLGGYFTVVSAYDPSHNIPDIGINDLAFIPVAILFVLYARCMVVIYRVNRSWNWKVIMVIILSSLMYLLPDLIHRFHAESNWG